MDTEGMAPLEENFEGKRQNVRDLLGREWQSIWLGHVVCRDFTDATQLFNVVSAAHPAEAKKAADRPAEERVLAKVDYFFRCGRDDDTCIMLTGTRDGHSIEYQVDKERSNAKRVIWIDNTGLVCDAWDCHLLEAARTAAAWLCEHSLPGAAAHLAPAFQVLQTESTASSVKVGLCMATKNRLWQLQRALPMNLLLNWPHRDWSTIHVVDCASTDGTLDWLRTNCQAAMSAGVLRVYTASPNDFEFWHASIGKNCAHAVATEDILVNVDSDNILGPGFALDVLERFKAGYTALQYENGDGTCGRIACRRDDFFRIRGYDEDAYPMGAQDVDLLLRLKMLDGAKFKKVKEEAFSQAIPNTAEEKVKNCDPKQSLKWSRMDAVNRDVFSDRRAAGQIIRNLHKIDVKNPALSRGIGVPVRLVKPEA